MTVAGKYSGSSNSGSTPWEPSVIYLLALVGVEILVMGILRSMTKHGG